LHRGQWGTVCEFSWDMRDAAVVCRELGCGEAVAALSRAHFGPGSGQIWMDYVSCSGSESTLKNCGSAGWGKHNCDHGLDAGVICSGKKSRLTDGFHLCSGRVEVLHRQTWSTMCDADFDQQDAEVVCRELGCGLPVEVLGAAAFGRGEGQVWSEQLQCRGNEFQISFCPTASSLKHNCSHDSDVGLVCAGKARLANGSDSCSGRVELQYLSEWGTVCDVNWDSRAASILCGQLKCGSTVAVLGSDWFGEGTGQIWAEVFDCQGNETHLSKCPISSWSRAACSHKQDAGVVCSGELLELCSPSQKSHSSIRLVGSGGDCAGRLEVFHSGSWGTVCGDLWDIEDAQVVCRQLQCGVALSALVPAWFGPGTGPIWLNEVECEGNETSLWNCTFQLSGEDEWGHEEDVGVMCSEFKEVRLTEGCEGNLEVFYNGTWGNVCVNGMDEETVSLICQELNCGRSGSESWAKARVESAPNWLDNLKCRRHDSTLWHCPSSPWRQNNCNKDNEVAWITCSGRQFLYHLPLRLRGGKGICSGRLEVYHNAEWGSICDDLWDIRDAQVICRQLGCGPALSADGSAVFGAGEGPIWLSRVKCRGNEIHLWDCPHSLKNHTDCSHKQDAGVTCAGQRIRVKILNVSVNGALTDLLLLSNANLPYSVLNVFYTIRTAVSVFTDISTTPLVITATTSNTTGIFKSLRQINKCRFYYMFLNRLFWALHSFCSVFLFSVGQTVKGTNTPPQTPPAAVPFIYPASLLVLGAVLFLALVLLVVLFYQNRVLRRGRESQRSSTIHFLYIL
uniref:SRCR domain-containing protein n=1 Tax=Pygocentrus nattereri TaxID=42514 RepID=A0A3B4DKL2_PYGNA